MCIVPQKTGTNSNARGACTDCPIYMAFGRYELTIRQIMFTKFQMIWLLQTRDMMIRIEPINNCFYTP